MIQPLKQQKKPETVTITKKPEEAVQTKDAI